MERRTRIWIGLGAAVLVSGTTVDRAALAGRRSRRHRAQSDGKRRPLAAVSRRGAGAPLRRADREREAGEGGPGEGGGQVLGTITEFRLGSTDPAAFQYDASHRGRGLRRPRPRRLRRRPRRRAGAAGRDRRPARRPDGGHARRRARGLDRRAAGLPADRGLPVLRRPGRRAGRPAAAAERLADRPGLRRRRDRGPRGRAELPQPRPPEQGRRRGQGHHRLARDRVPAVGRGRRPGRHRLRRRRGPTTAGATISPRSRSSSSTTSASSSPPGRRTPTTTAPRSRRWTSATPSAAPSTA